MFDNLVAHRTQKKPLWVVSLIVGSIVLHVALGSFLMLRQFWFIPKLPLPDTSAIFALSLPPPPPPGGKKERKTLEKKKIKVETEVQPKDPEEIEEVADSEIADDDGVDEGVEGGVVGGVVGGVIGGQGKIVPQVILEQHRIQGKQPRLPQSVKVLMIKQNRSKVITVVKMCLTAGGTVQTLSMIKSSGYAKYDAVVETAMRQWKYRPFRVNGRAVPVCTSVTFVNRF